MISSARSSMLSTLMLLGPWTPFVVALFDSAFVPLAQSVDLLIVVQATVSPASAYLGAALAVVGSTLGSLILYEIARRGGRMAVEKRVPAAKLETIRQQIGKYGALALALPTMLPLPLPMRPLVIGAGVFRMPISRFVVVIAGARAVRYLGIAFLALHYGESALSFLKQYGLVALACALGVGAVVFLIKCLLARRPPKRQPSKPLTLGRGMRGRLLKAGFECWTKT